MTTRIRTPLLVVLGFLVLTVAVALNFWLAGGARDAGVWVRHTLQVENQLATVFTHLQDAETNERGYLLTGKAEHLTAYADARDALIGDMNKLDGLIVDNPVQVMRLRRLRQLSAARMELLGDAITFYRSGDRERAFDIVRSGKGTALMGRVRGVVAAMQAEELRLQEERTATERTRLLWVQLGLMLSAIATLVCAVAVIVDARRRLDEVQTVNADLQRANDQLEREATQRQAAENQLRQMQKVEAIGQLTGGIAHDFNNMLAIVIGSLDMAKRRLETDIDRAGKSIDNALEGAQRATQLTARLLAFSRQQPLEPNVLDSNKLVSGMSEMLRRTLGEHIRVETVLAGGLWRCFADAGQVENALLNLCVNARDAMPDGGRLTIETANAHLDDAYAASHAEVTAGQYVLVSVSDTGMGMPAEVIERAFDPFFTTKGVGKGTGLGLSQVHGFVKQSGGHVKIYSEPGVGTTVRIYLPRARDDARLPPPSTEEMAAHAPRARGDEVILAVEDDERVRHMSVDTLRFLGYTVVQASDAQQALAVLAVQPRVDLLFTDVVMPDVNGRMLADRAREARPDLKVLYTTGYTRNAIVHSGMLDPGLAFIAKPFTVEQLAAKVRQVLDAT